MSGMDNALKDMAEIRFDAKSKIVLRTIQEAQDTIQAEMAKLTKARQSLDVREKGLKEWEDRLQQEEVRKRDELENGWKELEARQAAILAGEKEIIAKKLSCAATMKTLEGNAMDLLDREVMLDVREQELKLSSAASLKDLDGNRMDLLHRQMQLNARHTFLNELGRELDVRKDLLDIKEEDLAHKSKSLEQREAKLEAKEKELEDDFSRKLKSLEKPEAKVEAKEKDLEDDFSRKLKSLEKPEAKLEAKEKDLEDDFNRKLKSLEKGEAKLEAKEKKLNQITDRECPLIIKEEVEEQLHLRETNRPAEVEKMILEDHEWLEANAFIRSYEGNASHDMELQLFSLQTLIDIVGKAGVIPVLKKSFSVTFEVGLKENVDEGATSVLTCTGIDEHDGISKLIKVFVKYIKSHYLHKPASSPASTSQQV